MKDGVTAFVTGKSYGSTNMIAMDAEGRQIASFAVIVTPASERSVTLMKGARKTTLSCAPRCQEVGEATAAAAAEYCARNICGKKAGSDDPAFLLRAAWPYRQPGAMNKGSPACAGEPSGFGISRSQREMRRFERSAPIARNTA